jgi:anti-sigma regulatory factor (Ser/Thr protein kinase)
MNRPPAFRVLGVSAHTLIAVPSAAGRSRRLVRLGLTRWGLGRLIDDAELVVSELVTNAVQATGVADADANRAGPGGLAEIQVRLLLFDVSVVVEVWDGDPAPPVPQQVTGADEGGRGLSIVAVLAADWNWYRGLHDGKVVWAELPIPPHPRTMAGLPQRSRPGAVTGTHAGAVHDLALLNRVHRALRDW